MITGVISGEIEIGMFRCISDFHLRPDEDRDDELFLGSFDRTKQKPCRRDEPRPRGSV
jgi:hypothetical protein